MTHVQTQFTGTVSVSCADTERRLHGRGEVECMGCSSEPNARWMRLVGWKQSTLYRAKGNLVWFRLLHSLVLLQLLLVRNHQLGDKKTVQPRVWSQFRMEAGHQNVTLPQGDDLRIVVGSARHVHPGIALRYMSGNRTVRRRCGCRHGFR